LGHARHVNQRAAYQFMTSSLYTPLFLCLFCNLLLQDERLSFDQQISSLERTVQLKEHDLKELVQLSSKPRRRGRSRRTKKKNNLCYDCTHVTTRIQRRTTRVLTNSIRQYT
jgi:hypothetical protein